MRPEAPEPVCSLIVVNYNGKRYLPACLDSLYGQQHPADLLEVIVVDNGSRDGSLEDASRLYPGLRTLHNAENNFARALNLGIAASRGQYIGFVNNDVTLDPRWLPTVVEVLGSGEPLGAAGGKILLSNGRINSAGVRHLGHHYWQDIGFDEPDHGQFDDARSVDALCWAAVLFRRKCLEDVGDVDEDFVMYCEDVDYATRCRARGWRLVYTPAALAHHAYRGSSRGSLLAEFFCNRNRFLYIAKHAPRSLPSSVHSSHFYLNGQRDVLFECMPAAIKKLVEHHDVDTVAEVLAALCEVLVPIYGARAVDQVLARMEVTLGYRKLSVGIYDYALHTVGGGQKYVATMASIVQNDSDVTYIANKPVTFGDLESWYSIDLSPCTLKVLPLPFYEERGLDWIDPGIAARQVDNPFDPVAEESANYDVFVNANMLDKVSPLAPISVFVCHFPERFREGHFAVDRYSMIVVSSEYAREWTRRRWGLEATALVYPPVDMEAPPADKEPLILSVARFERGGTKKQLELIRAFSRLLAQHPDEIEGWRLVLAGGSLGQNPYLDEVSKAAEAFPGRIELRVNVSHQELCSLYARARIFWHACGLDETNPHLVEHFGMTTVEAMQNRCVPVVINGGGQREIVEHGRSGLLFSTLDQLCAFTLALIRDPERFERLGEGAYQRGQHFKPARFHEQVRTLFDLIRAEYATIRRPDPAEVIEHLAV